MKKRKNTASVAANPILVGAVTLVVIIVAVFLAYNANGGLPFVPTYAINVETANGERLVVGNEVREGGERIGQVANIETVKLDNGKLGAKLELSLDRKYAPIPDDTQYVIRSKGTLGLKYIDQIRGQSPKAFVENSVVAAGPVTATPVLDDFFSTFDEPTRENSRRNIDYFAEAFAGRGEALNRTFVALPKLLEDVVPVMQVLSRPDTDLRGFVNELGDFFRITAPVSKQLSEGFTTGANTFEAFSRNPDALDQFIAQSPPTLDVAIRELPVQRKLFRALADIGPATSAAAAELRRSSPPISSALAAGTKVLPDTVELSDDLKGSLRSLGALGRSPLANLTLQGLTSTNATLNPTLRYLGPQVTVCNHWNYFWTFLADHIGEQVQSGTIQRIQAKTGPIGAPNSPASFGAVAPANGERPLEGNPVSLHAQPYGRAVDENGLADCEQGQRGYPQRVAKGAPAGLNIAVDPRTPGNQGTTFTGKPRVPAGQTFSAEPDGRAPKVVNP